MQYAIVLIWRSCVTLAWWVLQWIVFLPLVQMYYGLDDIFSGCLWSNVIHFVGHWMDAEKFKLGRLYFIFHFFFRGRTIEEFSGKN